MLPKLLLCLFILVNNNGNAEEQVELDWDYIEVKDIASYWQKRTFTPSESVEVTDSKLREEKDKECPAGMVMVQGKMKKDNLATNQSVEGLQDQTCTNWIDRKFPARCASFDPKAWKKLSQNLPTKEMKFCMDRFEFPNLKGANPVIQVNWHEAQKTCKSIGKRLCTENEWTFACEGEEATPYPYGYDRSKDSCNIDRPWRDFSKINLLPKKNAKKGLQTLWQGKMSGEMKECKSVFGVYDLTGNVDEWTTSVLQSGYKSIMKGGYWSLVRNRCRPATRAHNEDHLFYQQGFRCCK